MTAAWAFASLAALAIAVGGTLTAVRRRFVVITIRGDSMAPTYRAGDRVLVQRRPLGEVARGDVVVLELSTLFGAAPPAGGSAVSTRQWAIKRVVALPGDQAPGGTVQAGRLYVLGDNAVSSRDSRQVGAIATDSMLGVVVRPLSRRRF